MTKRSTNVLFDEGVSHELLANDLRRGWAATLAVG